MKSKTITISGASGFIGTHLTQKLSPHNLVKAIDISGSCEIFDNHFEAHVSASDVVIHLAAETIVSESFKHPAKYFYTNVLGTARALRLCQKYNKKFIYISSAAVKDPKSSPYAESKYLAEELVKPFLSKKVTILRLENVYGEGMKKGTLLYNFIHNKELEIDGNGEQKRDYIHVDDVVNIIVKAIDKKWNGKLVEVGTGYPVSVNRIARIFHNRIGKPIVWDHNKKIGLKSSKADVRLLASLYPNQLKDVLNYVKEVCE